MKMRKSLMALSALVALAGSSRAQAQSTGSEKPATAVKPVTPKPAATPAAPRGQSEGIKVHGRWTIKVSNPDGKLVKDIEFENGLNPTTGGLLLTSILTGQVAPGIWGISLIVPAGVLIHTQEPSVCNHPQRVALQVGSPQMGYNQYLSGQAVCSLEPVNYTYIWQGATSGLGQYCSSVAGCFPVLAVTAPTASVPSITLAGQVTAETSGTITGVATTLTTCSPTSTPAVCLTDANPYGAAPPAFAAELIASENSFASLIQYMPWGFPITSTNLDGIPVLAGQIVSVAVAISFQ
jgi:hypothetical protein